MPNPLFTLKSQAGVRRDGTELDSPFYSEVVWTRFQRGKPRKMGGYTRLSGGLDSPVRSVFVQQKNGSTTAHYFSQWGVQQQTLSDYSATGLANRTPVGFSPDTNLNWSSTALYSSTGGAYSALIAASSPDLLDISSDSGGGLYAGSLLGFEPLSVIGDGSGPISVSGGVTSIQPFLVVYGSNGMIRNSNTNDFSTATGWTTGGANKANTANVAGSKIIYGAPVRGGGQSPAGLFWALDSVIRMSFVGGTAIWAFDTLSNPTSILSKRCVVEHDGKFFWVGTDRFLMYNGVVQELPNAMNANYFFEGLNYAHRNKVWGTKIGRFGEIWWFYPRGTDTECNHAIIFSYVENTWYDAECQRSAGHSVQLYRRPVWAGDEDSVETTALPVGFRLVNSAQTLGGSLVLTFVSTTGVANGQLISGHSNLPAAAAVAAFTATTVTMTGAALGTIPVGTTLTFSSMTTPFLRGQTATGGTSAATGVVERADELSVNVSSVSGTFVSGETITGPSSATADLLDDPYDQVLSNTYAHEIGYDKVSGSDVFAIPASFTTNNFGLTVGAPFDQAPQTMDVMTRLIGLEPDFGAVGDLTVSVDGKSYATGTFRELSSEVVATNTPFINPRVQERILRVKVASNTLGGFFELGRVLVEVAPGDERGSE